MLEIRVGGGKNVILSAGHTQTPEIFFPPSPVFSMYLVKSFGESCPPSSHQHSPLSLSISHKTCHGKHLSLQNNVVSKHLKQTLLECARTIWAKNTLINSNKHKNRKIAKGVTSIKGSSWTCFSGEGGGTLGRLQEQHQESTTAAMPTAGKLMPMQEPVASHLLCG